MGVVYRISPPLPSSDLPSTFPRHLPYLLRVLYLLADVLSVDCHRLDEAESCYISLRISTFIRIKPISYEYTAYIRLQQVTAGYRRLQQVTASYRRLQQVTAINLESSPINLSVYCGHNSPLIGTLPSR